MDNGKKRGLVVRLLSGFWWGLDQSRRLVVNVLFLFLVVLFVQALLEEVELIKPRTALVIAPEGELVEQYSADPASRALAKALGDEVKEVQLRDLLRAIELAKDDDRIERIVLRPDGLSGGYASLREVAAALREFRDSGKQVVAYADGMDQRQYLLAAQADEIYLHPSGILLLEGLARYRPYFREGLQDKLDMDVHLFKVGEYKSAAEPFVLDAPSPESLEADRYWMNDVWQRYLEEIAKARELAPEAIARGIDELPERVAAVEGDLARLAQREGLVDGLKTLDEVRALLIERGAADEDGTDFRQIDLEDYLAHRDHEQQGGAGADTLAVVVAQGEIVSGEAPPGGVGGESTAALIRKAREDEKVKGLLLRVDSPGGEVFPSEQIRREVELTRAAGKPVVVSMGNVAASGGYWISMNADRIYADPSTITGSIGIFGLFLNMPRTLEKIGVRVGGSGTTWLAGALDPTRPLEPKIGALIQRVIEHGYGEFIGKVAAARDSTPEEIDRVGRGRVWSGAQALERGLVDKLGGLREAQAGLAELAHLDAKAVRWRYIEKELTPFQRFIAGLGGNEAGRALIDWLGLPGQDLFDAAGARAQAELRWLRPGRAAAPVRPLAHCFCGL